MFDRYEGVGHFYRDSESWDSEEWVCLPAVQGGGGNGAVPPVSKVVSGVCWCGKQAWRTWALICGEHLEDKRHRAIEDLKVRDPEEAARLAAIWGINLSAGTADGSPSLPAPISPA